MKRANSDLVVAGFSLIEAMAALALTATVILALSSVAGQWLPNWRRGFVDLQRATCSARALTGRRRRTAAEYVTPSAAPRRH
jgi:general secretion pathway protein J